MSNEKSKIAIVVMSDPKAGSDEALGRVFNALTAAYDFRSAGDEVQIHFLGAGTRWPGEIVNPEHPAHGLFQEVKETIAGASCGCADVFCATDSVRAAGVALRTDLAVPGTEGVTSLRTLVREGFRVLTF